MKKKPRKKNKPKSIKFKKKKTYRLKKKNRPNKRVNRETNTKKNKKTDKTDNTEILSEENSSSDGETLSDEAIRDEKIVAITAAMASGTGLDIFAKNHPKKFRLLTLIIQNILNM